MNEQDLLAQIAMQAKELDDDSIGEDKLLDIDDDFGLDAESFIGEIDEIVGQDVSIVSDSKKGKREEIVIEQPPDAWLDERESRSKNNAQELKQNLLCGCYSCQKTYSGSIIKKSNIKKGTIHCPYCKEPAVLVSRHGERVASGVLWRLWYRTYARTVPAAVCGPLQRKKNKKSAVPETLSKGSDSLL